MDQKAKLAIRTFQMSRLPLNDRTILAAKALELRETGQCTARYLHAWAKKEGLSSLSRVPAISTLQKFTEKCLEFGDIEKIVKDKPRSQLTRGGKRAPVSRQTKRIIHRRVMNRNRPRHERRMHFLASQTHAGRLLSKTTIRRILLSKGFRFRRSQRTIALKPHHKQLRERWARKWRHKPKTFWRKFLFSDEKIFKLQNARHRQNDGLWVQTEDANDELVHTVDRHSTTIQVWGGISYWGLPKLVFIADSNNGEVYKREVIRKIVVPFLHATEGCEVFMQDGAGFHKSKTILAFLDDKLGPLNYTQPPPAPCKKVRPDGKLMRFPKADKNGKIRQCSIDRQKCNCQVPSTYVHMAKSPDLNPIENVWAKMTTWINQQPRPHSSLEFRQLVFRAWDSLSLEYIRSLFDSMPRRFEQVVARNGDLTCY